MPGQVSLVSGPLGERTVFEQEQERHRVGQLLQAVTQGVDFQPEFAHLGFDMDSPGEADQAAELGRASGCLHWEPANHPPPVGYLCAVTDPDGNVVEFSFGQGLGAVGD
ncbi:MAG: hypothetical protein CL435_04485 [Acidimicrobiaceae bacterium]|nr:hypothetical protein [Acidimicrobiaceae bacterium]